MDSDRLFEESIRERDYKSWKTRRENDRQFVEISRKCDKLFEESRFLFDESDDEFREMEADFAELKLAKRREDAASITYESGKGLSEGEPIIIPTPGGDYAK